MTNKLSLNGEWRFVYAPRLQFQEGDENIPVIPPDEAFEADMPVPGYWDDNLKPLQWTRFWTSAVFNNSRRIDFPMGIAAPDLTIPYLLGVGFYKRTVDIPSGWGGRAASLEIGGARMNAWAWVNGQYAGYHRFSMIPWELRHDKPPQARRNKRADHRRSEHI